MGAVWSLIDANNIQEETRRYANKIGEAILRRASLSNSKKIGKPTLPVA